jgi:hypothetical protein
MTRKVYTTENFIEKSNLVHNNKYDYSKTIIINSTLKVKMEIVNYSSKMYWD